MEKLRLFPRLGCWVKAQELRVKTGVNGKESGVKGKDLGVKGKEFKVRGKDSG